MPVSPFAQVMRFGLFALLGTALVACGETASPGSSASATTQANANVPAGFSKCTTFSGDAATLTDKDGASEWQYQSAQANATSGNVEVYSANSADCTSMPDIRPGSAKIIANAVVTYKDVPSANSAYSGVFGVNSSVESGKPGAVKGAATGFGTTSVYVYSTGESMAIWVSGNKVVAIVGEGISSSDFKTFANSLK